MARPSREEMVAIILDRFVNPSGCWSDYNDSYVIQNDLAKGAEFARWYSLVKADEVPAEPEVEDYPNNNC